MKCERCGGEYPDGTAECPACAAPSSGVFRTSTVLIATGGVRRSYASVGDIPRNLRNALRESTSGPYSGAIVIADQAGREKIAGRGSVAPDARNARPARAEAGIPPGKRARFRPPAGRLALGAVILLVLVAAALVFRWR
jgi:hypothetical protein